MVPLGKTSLPFLNPNSGTLFPPFPESLTQALRKFFPFCAKD